MSGLPNVLVIYTDQQSNWTLGCYGGDLIDTPHLDGLAREGALFSNYFVNSAVCTPSRGCLMTGRYPHFNGAFRNNQPLGRDEETIGHLLARQGYDTAYMGKWHLNGDPYPGWPTGPEEARGFKDNRYMFNRGHFKEALTRGAGESPEVSEEIGDEHTFMTDWLADRAVEYFREPREKPFLLVVSIPDPHTPHTVRAPYDTMFDPQTMPIPETFHEEKLPDWAEEDAWGRKKSVYGKMTDPKEREAKLKGTKAKYCGQVKCIDDNVGKMLTALERHGLAEDTVVIFTSDHGEYMGEHGLRGKNNLYETAYHVPLIVRWPSRIRQGMTVERLVAGVDFLPTLLGLLDLPSTDRIQGRDASPLLRGEDAPWEDEVFIHPNDVPRTGLFTREFELAYVGKGWKTDREFREHILFDRVNDPLQQRNLFFEPEYAQVIDGLTERLVSHHRKLGTKPDVLPSVIAARL